MCLREVALCAVVAVLSILAPARETTGAVDNGSLPAGVIASVGVDNIKVEEFQDYCDFKGAKLGESSVEEREGLLKDFLVERILAREGRTRGLGDPAGMRSQLERLDRAVLPELYFQREFVSKAVVEDKDFETYYQGLGDMADLSVAVLATEQDALDFVDRARKGEAFEELVGRYSLGNSAQKAGLIPEITPGDNRFTQEEKNAIFAAANGAVLGPFANKLASYSVIKVLKRQTVEDQKRAIRETKAQEVKDMKAATAYLQRINDEIVKSEIEINEEFFEKGEGEKRNREGEKRPYLAWVKGQYIYPQDLGVSADAESHGAKEYRGSLDKAIRSIVAADVARKAGIAELPEYLRKRDVYITGEIVARLLEDDFRKAKVSASEKEIKQYYRENYSPDVYSLWLVINADRDKVEAARREVLADNNFKEAAAKYSDDPTRKLGGATGYFPLSAFEEPTRAVVKGLKGDEVSEPFIMNGKPAIIRVIDRKTFPVPSLSEVRDKVRQRIILRKRAKVVEEKRAAALKKERVTIDGAQLARMK